MDSRRRLEEGIKIEGSGEERRRRRRRRTTNICCQRRGARRPRSSVDVVLARKKSRPTTKESFDSLKREERMTTEFFQRFQSRASNSAIPELFVTGDWNAPGDDTRNTTTDDAEIRSELRKYYVWLYQERSSIRDHDLEETLETHAQ